MAESTAEPLHLFISNYPFEPSDRERLSQGLGEALVLVQGDDALRQALAAHPDADVVCPESPPADLLTLAPSLRWLALASAGADAALAKGLIRADGPIVTTANGVHAVQIGEYVLSAMLLWAHRWPRLLQYQQQHVWPTVQERAAQQGDELHGATLGVVGLGAIGRRVAQLGRALGMRVLAVRRSATAGATDPDTDELLPMERLDDLLRQSDYVVLTLPSTPETHHLIDDARLRLMKPSAFLVNIARGAVVDEAALVRALTDGTIAGAGLDVFEREPLPAESPLWSLPNVILSPHISGMSARYSERLTDLLLDNIARYRQGQPLRNQVDPQRGY